MLQSLELSREELERLHSELRRVRSDLEGLMGRVGLLSLYFDAVLQFEKKGQTLVRFLEQKPAKDAALAEADLECEDEGGQFRGP